ncbi:hypothetical protein ACLBXB_21865 [Methylobacterium mesophilicum]
MSEKTTRSVYQFVVYDPPAPGLPWLTVCLGPSGEVLEAEAWTSLEEAQRMTEKAAQMVADSVDDELQARSTPKRMRSQH